MVAALKVVRGGGSASPVFAVLRPALRSRLVRAMLVCVSSMLACATAPAQLPQTNATVAPAAQAHAALALEWSEQEKRAIARHGPWPQPVLPDRSNRGSGNADAVVLGGALFFDVRLSPKGDMACASCHQSGRAFSDGRDRAHGRERLDRNTPGLWNAGLGRWFGWDGGADSLWGFALRPMLNTVELAASPSHVARLLRSDAAYACLHRNAFDIALNAPKGVPGNAQTNTLNRGQSRSQRQSSEGDKSKQGAGATKAAPAAPAVNTADERLMVDAAKALAAFMETLQSGKSAFDELHDALARGDAAAAARYPEDARRGLRLFTERGQCAVCHFGPNFSNGEFHEVGIPYLVDKGRVDPGRQGGIKLVRADRYNLLGAFSDDASRASGSRTRHVAENHANYGQFKTPSLRNVELTAPYMHNGKLATLRDVVQHYSEIPEDRLHQDGEALLKPLRLTEGEANDLVAFLRTLTSKTFPEVNAATPVCQPRK